MRKGEEEEARATRREPGAEDIRSLTLAAVGRCLHVVAVLSVLAFAICVLRWVNCVRDSFSGEDAAFSNAVTFSRRALQSSEFLMGPWGGAVFTKTGEIAQVRPFKDEHRAFWPAVYIESERLIFCPVQKVASAGWQRVLEWLAGDPEWRNERYPRNVPKVAAHPDGDAVMQDPQWIRFVVVREPAERLLAVFLDKCYFAHVPGGPRSGSPARPGQGNTCDMYVDFPDFWRERRNGATVLQLLTAAAAGAPPPPDAAEDAAAEAAATAAAAAVEGEWTARHPAPPPPRATGGVAPGTAAAKDLQEAAMALDADPVGMFRHWVGHKLDVVEAGRCGVNKHYRPQACFCGVAERLDSFVVVPFHSMHTAVDTVFGERFRPDDPKRRAEVRRFVSGYFRENREDAGKQTNTNATTVAKFFTPELLARLRVVFSEDYRLFGEYF